MNSCFPSKEITINDLFLKEQLFVITLHTDIWKSVMKALSMQNSCAEYILLLQLKAMRKEFGGSNKSLQPNSHAEIPDLTSH